MSSPSLQIADTLLAASSAALRRAAQFLLSRQAGEGYWCGELTADTTLRSDLMNCASDGVTACEKEFWNGFVFVFPIVDEVASERLSGSRPV